MASTKVVQRSFTGGEICPDMFGRFDDLKYANGLEKAENFIVLPQGPIENRAGFAHVAEVKDSTKPVRLIPFAYNTSQTMIIELGDKYARFHTEGQTLMNAEGTAPYEIVTPWSADDLFDLHYVQSADIMTLVHRNYAPHEIRRYSYQDWRCVACNFDRKIANPTSVNAVRHTQAADDKNADRYHFRYKVAAMSADKISESEAVEASYPGGSSEGVEANLYAYGTTVKVSWDPVDGATFYRVYKCQGGLFGFIGDTEDTYIIDDDNDPDMSITPRRYDDVFKSDGGIQSVNVLTQGSGYTSGRQGIGAYIPETEFVITYTRHVDWEGRRSTEPYISYAYANKPDETPLTWEVYIYDANGTGSGAAVQVQTRTVVEPYVYGGYNWKKTTYFTGYTVTNYGSGYTKPMLKIQGVFWCGYANKHPIVWETDLPTVSHAQILVTDSTGTGAELVPVIEGGKVVNVTVRNPGRGYTNPTIKIIGNTGSGATFKANLGSGGDYPAAVGYFEQRKCFAGMAGDPQRIVMTRSGTEDDFSYSLPTRDDDRISQQIAVTEFNDIRHLVSLSQLLLMTAGAEVRISPLNSDALTPSSFGARPQSYVGCSNVMPVMVNNNVIYAAARGGHVREFAYQDTAGGYVSGDLCLRSSHLFDFKSIVDMALQKAPTPIVWFVSSDGSLLGLTYIPEQQVGAWHRHTTRGTFESVACVTEGDQDSVYVVVQRNIVGQTKRFIERMSSRQISNIADAFFVDCGGTYRGDAVTEVSGLDWLEGETVSILADGAVQPPQDVTGGKIHLSQPASVVHVGLPYTADAKTLPVVLETVAGAGMGVTKNVYKAHLRVYNSSGVLVGPTFDELTEYKQRTTESPGTPPNLKTGEIEVGIRPTWSQDGTICIRQTDPLPLKVLSLALELGV